MYAASFLLCIFFGALLKQIGTPGNYVNLMMFALILGGYLFSGLFAKTMVLPVFQNAERTGRAFYIGQTLAAGLISSGVFIFLAGDFYSTGTDALTLFSGLILGVALMTLLFAAPINRSQSQTLASLIAPKNVSRFHRFIIMSIIIITSMMLLYVQLSAIGLVSEAYFGISEKVAVMLAALTIGFCLILGGIQSLSIMRMIAYPILIISFLVPIVWIAYQITGNPFPQLSFGVGALQAISEIDSELLNAGLVQEGDIFDISKDGTNYDTFNHFSALICIALGTAAMPHLLQHFRILPRATNARKTGVWGLGFLLVILTTIPAMAAFVKLDIYTSLLGLQLSDLEQEADWLFALNQNSQSVIAICGNYLTQASQAVSACGQSSDYFLASKDISLNPDMLVLTSGVLSGLPDLMTTLLATGALLAIWSTADGLIFVCANALAEDGYRSLFRPKAPMGSRLFVTRVCLVGIIALSSYLALTLELSRTFIFSASFALLAASLFPALVCRIWLSHFKPFEITTGIICGFIITASLLWLSHSGLDLIVGNGDEIIFNLPGLTNEILPLTMGLIGMVISFSVTFAVAKFNRTKSRSKDKHEAKLDVPA